MDQEVVGYIVLLVIVTLLSVVQNAFFASKVEQESKNSTGKIVQRGGSSAFERVFTASLFMTWFELYGYIFLFSLWCYSFSTMSFPSQNCRDAYPTFLAVLWCAGLLCSQAPAAFAGLMYLFVRQKYFIGYMGERTQSTPGYIFGKRIILFLFLMSVAGVLNYYLGVFFGSDFQIYIKTITGTISPLLLIP